MRFQSRFSITKRIFVLCQHRFSLVQFLAQCHFKAETFFACLHFRVADVSQDNINHPAHHQLFLNFLLIDVNGRLQDCKVTPSRFKANKRETSLSQVLRRLFQPDKVFSPRSDTLRWYIDSGHNNLHEISVF